jgi:hypothetical protein
LIGQNVFEYLAVLPSRVARVIAGARWKSSVLDLQLDQKIDGASGCLHSCMHCGEAQGDTMEACVHRMLYCSAVQSSVDVSLSGLWPKAELGSTHGIGLGVFYSVLNGTLIKTRVDKVRYGLFCSWNRFVQVGVYGGGWIYGGAGSGHEIPVTTY